MLTVKKLNNLFMYFVLFKTCDDMNVSKILPHHTYIAEKFDLFFNSPPDIEKLFMDLHWGNQEVWNRGTDYIVKWNEETNEFINHENYSKWLFTHYLVHSTVESTKMREEQPDMDREERRFRRMIQIYNKFFSSYDFISEDNLENTLHAKLREFYHEVVDIHKHIFRNVYVNQQTKK